MRIAICDDNPQDIERIKRYQTVVEYSLAGYQNPIGVAEWKKPDSAGLTRGIEKQLAVYRRNRKGIGVKSATGCGTITKDTKRR